jgi:serine/threonine-protein kinase RsbW
MPSRDVQEGPVALRNDRAEIDALCRRVLAAAEGFGYLPPAVFAIRLALEEAISNAFLHGHRDRPADPIEVSFRVSAGRVRMVVVDRGPGFRPADVPDPTLDENLLKPSGRGLMLMRAFMTRVAHDRSGRRVTMVYERARGGSADAGTPSRGRA